eukprot:6196332-Pleurochrysis_carterae.AAC.2
MSRYPLSAFPMISLTLWPLWERSGKKWHISESACNASQEALRLGEYQVAATNDEAVMAAVRGDPRLPNELRSLPAHLLVHFNALETRPEVLQHDGQDANCDALLDAHRSSWLAATPEFEEEAGPTCEGGNTALGALG